VPLLKLELYKIVADRHITLGSSSWVVAHLQHTGSHKIAGNDLELLHHSLELMTRCGAASYTLLVGINSDREMYR
jgi:hypothetical protein